MPLSEGNHLGQYEVLSLLGKGGMGEVYRARDTKLKRDVAIKVLPEDVARDPERMARFQHEAQVLASLNHPNIATIHGVEERALVMELVEGDSPKGPMPVEEVRNLALQMATALEYAHDKGIVHRDLKPANIKVTPDGVVKLLDFGLAKAFSNQKEVSASAENSPTMTMQATQAGIILGTAAYMSPEQARGKSVDKRADIWAFGAVVWELLTGERLHKGESVTDTLASVLKEDPEWNKVPAQFRPLLRRCLEKDPRKRLRDIGDAMPLVTDGQSDVQTEVALSKVSRPSKWPWLVAALFALGASAVAVIHFREKPAAATVTRYQIRLPDNVNFTSSGAFTLSPDGQHIAFQPSRQGTLPESGYRIWMRWKPACFPTPSRDKFHRPSSGRRTAASWCIPRTVQN
jgi:serine/threonine protein kinase